MTHIQSLPTRPSPFLVFSLVSLNRNAVSTYLIVKGYLYLKVFQDTTKMDN